MALPFRRSAVSLAALTAFGAVAAPACRSHRDGTPAADAGPRQPHPTRHHPDFPEPALAGTDDLFLRHEPLRGPHVTAVTLPERSALRFSDHTYCELGPAQLVCSSTRPRADLPSHHFNVGRANDHVVLAEELGPSGAIWSRVLLDWDANGRLTRVVTLEQHGQVARARSFNPPGERYTERTLSGANGLPGCGTMALKLDAKGQVAEAACLQWNGSPMRDTNGVAVTQYRHDGWGFVVEAVRLGLDHKPIAGQDRVHRITYQRADSGRLTAMLFFDLAGKPVLSTSDGCSGRRYDYDDRGILTRESCLGKDGELARSDEGVAITTYETNPDGCTVARHYLDRDARPTHIHGVYVYASQIDAGCDERAASCLGQDGEPVPCGPEEPAAYDFERDEKGRVVSMKHRNADGNPGHDSEYDVFEIRKEWDTLGNLAAESCWGASGEPVECDHAGYHERKLRIDDAGRTREVRYLGIDGTPAANLGVAIRRYIYDNYDHLHEIDGFDADGNVVDAMGMSAQRRLYDSGHRLFALLLYDKAGQPARYPGCFTGRDCPTQDWHAVRIFRGDNGHVTRNEYFDADGQLLLVLDCNLHRCWQ